MNMQFIKKLPIPKEVKAMFPLTPDLVKLKQKRDDEIKAVFSGKLDRFILLIGPCSADREDAVMDYMERLAGVQEKVSSQLLIIPRLYTGKPRSSGFGYMGLVHQPDPNGEENLYEGIISVRKLHINVLNNTGFSCADEMLYPENYRYLSDLLSYAAVGARSCENQQHRLTASGLNIPVGFKNPTGGNLDVMMQSINAATMPHHFIYRRWEVKSEGNQYAHGVLRGYSDHEGKNHPNYGYDCLMATATLFQKYNIENPAIIVDVNHANSDKDPNKQIPISLDVLQSRKRDFGLNKMIKGLMIESYLEDGCQPVDGTCFGKSITDPCLGWKKTEALIYSIADKI